jgi:hypothetical protein
MRMRQQNNANDILSSRILGKDFQISTSQSFLKDFVSSTMAAHCILSVVYIKIVKMDSYFQTRLNHFQRVKTLGK